MNDISNNTIRAHRCCEPIPVAIPLIAVPLVLVGLAVSVFILVVVHNPVFLAFLLFVSTLLLCFLLWNMDWFGGKMRIRYFLDSMPLSDIRSAVDGQIVKISGIVSCGDLSLESSYEKVNRCVYTSTLLYEYIGILAKATNADIRRSGWNLICVERFSADFFITDTKSGLSALVKAGYASKVNPLIEENIIVNTSTANRELSSTLRKWLGDRHYSSEARLLRLAEGYIREGSHLTVMGMLNRKNGVLTIVPLPEPITTGCLLRTFLLPSDVDGLILAVPGITDGDSTLSSSFPNPHT